MILNTLICKRDINSGIKCLSSLENISEQKFQIRFIEDGTLEKQDIDVLKNNFPDSEIIEKSSREEFVLEKLSKYPACVKFREKSAFGYKLFDVPLLSDEIVHYIDSDILFIKRIDKLFPMNESIIFIHEDMVSLSGSTYDILIKYNLDFIKNFNAGILKFHLKNYDLDFIEWFMSKNELNAKRNMPEQTCWAAMFANQKALYYDPTQFHCNYRNFRITDKTIAIHFLGESKSKIENFDFHNKNIILPQTPIIFNFKVAKRFTYASAIEKKIKSMYYKYIKNIFPS